MGEREVIRGYLTKKLTLSDTKNPPKPEASWGFHLLVDCSECNKNIDDEKFIEGFLGSLVKELKMKTLGPPMVVRVDSAKEGRGVSAIQMIETSHIACHFDDAEMSAYIDVFSCRTFDPEMAVKHIEKCFQPKRMAKEFLYRDAGLTKGKK